MNNENNENRPCNCANKVISTLGQWVILYFVWGWLYDKGWAWQAAIVGIIIGVIFGVYRAFYPTFD